MADKACYQAKDDTGNIGWIDVTVENAKKAEEAKEDRIYYCIGCLGKDHSNTFQMETHCMKFCNGKHRQYFSLFNDTCSHIPGCPYDKKSKSDATSEKIRTAKSKEPSPVTKASDGVVLDITAPPSDLAVDSENLDKTGKTVKAEEFLDRLMRGSHSVARATEKKSKVATSEEEIPLPSERLVEKTPNVTVQPENPSTVKEFIKLLFSLLPTDRYGNPSRFVYEWIRYKKTLGYYNGNPNAMIGIRFGVFDINTLRYDEDGCRIFLKSEEKNHCEYALQFTDHKIVSAFITMKFALRDLNNNLAVGESRIDIKIAVFANWIPVEPISKGDCAREYGNINQNTYLGIASSHVTDAMLRDLNLIPKTNKESLRFVLGRLQKFSLTKKHFGIIEDKDYDQYMKAMGKS